MASRLLKMADELDASAAGHPSREKTGGSYAALLHGKNFSGVCAESIFRDRQLRTKFFPTVPFADPAWDLLLDLYWRGLKGEIVTVSNACMAAGVPTTTALRWIDILIELGLVTREADVADRRRILLQLTADSRQRMETYLSEIVLFHHTLAAREP